MTLILLFANPAFAASHRDWRDLRKQIEQILHVRRPLPALQAVSYGSVSPASDITADRVSYVTDYGLRVPAIVYRQSNPTTKRHPALVIVNGHGGDKSSWYAYWAGILYARAGAVVLTYDPLGEFERNKERISKSNQHDTLLPPGEMADRLSGLMITDVMQAVTYLRKRHDVDRKRIAVLGYSMGSFVTALTCALDTRIHACVLAAGGDLDGPNGYWDNSRKMCQGIPYRSLLPLGNRGATLYALNAQRGPTLILNGTDDRVVDIPHHGPAWFEQLRQETAGELGNSKNIFESSFQSGGGHRPYFITKPAALWLNDKLRFPNWNAKQIERMPEVRFSQWASQHHMPVNPSPDFELNEGGTLALDIAVSAVPRDQMHAVPESVWDSQYRSFTYETWVERAQAAIRSGVE